MHAVIPLKGFDVAKERLAPLLDHRRRSSLATAAAGHVVSACADGGFDLAVVTGDEAVAKWAMAHSARVIPDPARGLNAACSAGIAASPGSWIVVHGDLPLLDAATMRRARAALVAGRPVIAPSRDGGTNLLGGRHRIHLSYGPGSFHRHLAALPKDPYILTGIESIIELDTPADVSAAAGLPGGAWLAPFVSQESPERIELSADS